MSGADLLARIGGEEFLIALLGIEDAQALEICKRLRDQVAAHDWRGLHPTLAVSISIGLTVGIPSSTEPAAMQARADRALHAAKRAGRYRVALG